MPIRPARLQGISTDHSKSRQHKTFFRIANFGPHHISENIRFAATGCARAGATQEFQRKIRFNIIIPPDGQFFANQLNILWLDPHREDCSRPSRRRSILDTVAASQSDRRARTKDRCPNAHQSRALFNRNRKIVTHTHGKFRQLDLAVPHEAVA